MADWDGDLERWLAPFLARLGHKARRRMCPLYVAGLIGPGDRKSVEPMASRWAPGDYDQLHHFIASGVWDEAPLTEELAIQADKLIGGAGAVLVVDDTALPKKGSHSVGVAPQYASALGKTANCQTLVSLTLARDEVPVMIGLRLFLPESWTGAARADDKGPRARELSRGAYEAGDRSGRDRSHSRRWRPFCNGAGGCRLWPIRAVPPGARHARPEVGGRNPQAAESLSEQCQARVSDCGTRAAPQALIFPISFPRPRKPCSPRRSGEASVGVKEPRGLWRPPSPPYACGSPMVRHNASMTRACSTCRARRPGSSASVAPRASANPIFPTCLPTPA